MRILIAILVMVSFAAMAHGQRLTEYLVTSEDIQIRFPGAAGVDGDWHNAITTSIIFSGEPIAESHTDKARIGLQLWEFGLQANMEIFEKAIVTIDVSSIPENRFKTMDLRARIRVEASNGIFVLSPWSDPSTVKIIGKTGATTHSY